MRVWGRMARRVQSLRNSVMAFRPTAWKLKVQMHYRFHVQRIGPVKLVLGGLMVAGLLMGAVLFASVVTIIGLAVGLLAAAAGLVTYGVKRFFNPNGEEVLERRAEGIVLIERSDVSGARSIEVEVVDDGPIR